MKTKIRFILTLTFITLLSACGFHPREPANFSPQLGALYINTTTPNDPFIQTLHRTLVANDVNVVPTITQASAILNILNIQTGNTMMAGGGLNISGAYVASLTVNFSVTDKNGKMLITPTAVQQSQNFMSNATQVLSGNSTVNQLTDQMQQSLATQIINQLAKIPIMSNSTS